MSGECVISLVLSCCNKDLKLQTSVVAWLWLRVLFSKQRIVHLGGVRVSNPKGEASSRAGSLFLQVLFPAP